MASAAKSGVFTETIVKRLGWLQRKLRQWLAVHGAGRWLWMVLCMLAVDLIIDRVFKMDFSQRAIILVVMAGLALVWLFQRLWRPLTRGITTDALLFEVERSHPQLGQVLINSLQLDRDSQIAAKGWSPQLAEATVERGLARLPEVDFGAALDQIQGRRNQWILLAGLAAAALLVVGIWQTDFLNTWFRRNLMLTSDQWPQNTYLEIAGVEQGVLVVPRGTDHRQLVSVTENSSVTNVDVQLEVESGGGRMLHSMKPTGKQDGREHAFTFHSVASEFRFRASGGDDVTEWVQVKLAEPPGLTQLILTGLLPSYTQQARLGLEGGGPHALLIGSGLELTAESNKPLKTCELRMGELTWPLEPDATRQKFSFLFSPDKVYRTLPGDANVAPSGVPSGKYTMHLVDEEGLANVREFSFTIKSVEDQSPAVRAKLLGISGLVVPRAIVPTSFNVTDDFGVQQLKFDVQWSAGEQAASQSQQIDVWQAPAGAPTTTIDEVAVLRLEPLGLTPDTSLRFVLMANDLRPPTPGVGQSREFLLRVVTEEELRADLLRREIEQRRAFQQAYETQLELVSGVRQLTAAPEGTPEEWDRNRQNSLISLFRSQRAIGTSVDSIANRFEEFLVEVKNNRLDEEMQAIDPARTIESRFSNEIIGPIRELDVEWISNACRNLDNCRMNLADAGVFASAVAQTLKIQDEILERMRQILASMEDSENFQEVVNKLLEIKRVEERMKQELKGLDNPERIFDKNKGIFDDDK